MDTLIAVFTYLPS